MKIAEICSNTKSFRKAPWLGLASLFLLSGQALGQDDEVTHDGLVRIQDTQSQVTYVDPDADFTVYNKVAILEPQIAFRANWRRDQNRQRSSRNISTRDMERIKEDLAELFMDVFVETIEADDGFEVVDVTGPDVLLIRPAIIDLDVTAPDINTASRTRNYTSTAGSATMFIELFDSMTLDILGRAVDAREARRPGGQIMWSSRVTNRQEATALLRQWAQRLRDFLDAGYPLSATGDADED